MHNYELLSDPDVPFELLEDTAFLLQVARANIKSLVCMPEMVQLDRKFLLHVSRDNAEGWRVFNLCPAVHRSDQEMLLAVVRGPGQGWRALRYADQKLREDKEFMLAATAASGTSIEYASADVRAEDNLVIAAIAAHSLELEKAKPGGKGIFAATYDKVSRDVNHVDDLSPSKETTSGPPVSPSPVSQAACKSVFREATKRQNSVVLEKALTEDSGQTKRRLSAVLKKELTEEFTSMKSGAVIDHTGLLTRLVQIVALNVKRADGTMLVWLGHRYKGESIEEKAVLPGGKFKEGDSPKDAVDRLLKNEMRLLSKGIKLKPGYSVTTKTMFSERYQCRTQYFTAMFEATMDPSFDFLSVMKPLKVEAVDLRPRLRARTHESFCRRFCVEGTHARPDMFELVFPARETQWPPIQGEWPPKKTLIFAWLPPWEMAWLTTSTVGTAALKEWMKVVSLAPGDGESDGEEPHQLRRSSTAPFPHRRRSSTGIHATLW